MFGIRLLLLLVTLSALTWLTGCGTTTQRVATEQLLMSDAVDNAISRLDFYHLKDQSVYLDTAFVRPVKSVGFVNADYIISSLRQQIASAGCLIQDKREDADIIIEPRVGALGTDGHEVTYGVPQTQALSSAAALFSGGAPVPAVPEISFGRSDAQSGIAKVIVFAYERETKRPVWQSGVAKAESNSKNTWVLGAGPFQKGSIYKGFRFAGQKINQPKAAGHMSAGVQYDKPHLFMNGFDSIPDQASTIATSDEDNSSVQQASGQEDK